MTAPQQSQEPGRKVKNGPHWLDRYATPFHDWTSSHTGGRTTYQRPLGLVELSFDADGVHYGGRADMTATLTLALSHSLSPTEFRHRIAAAWTALRLRHVLLMSRCIESTDDSSSSFSGALRRFSIDLPGSEEEAVQETLQSGIVWVENFYGAGEVDPRTLHDHALNVGRIVDPAICLSKLLVLPVRQKEDGTSELSLLVIMGHQISDGLSAYSWFSDLIRLLNLPPSTLSTEIHSALQHSIFSTRLPPAQESLYPAVKGSRARQRWIWAILRVLRHVQHTLPPSFSNPLYRSTRLKTARPLPKTYPKLFSYSPASLPPNSTAHINATLSPAASARMQALCRSASLSIGAGCFALAGLAMMDLHSTLSPSSSPPAMTASFPLNPRSFFTPSPSPDSCMLSFSDGIVLGHTSRSLPITSRFLLTARLANRELRAYQKRGRQTSLNAGGAAAFDRHAPARLLATGYLAQIERVVARGSETAKQLGFVGLPQGELEAKKGPMATCGVSSVGSLKGFFRAGEYDLGDESKDFVVDYRGVRMGVRAREGEFLIGSSTDGEGRVGFGVSYDASAIDPEKAELWARTITGLLEESKAKL